MTDSMRQTIQTVLNHIASGRIDELGSLTSKSRLTREDISNVVKDYGKQLMAPPVDAHQLADIIEVENSRPKRWSVAVPLWTREEGRSDLTLEMTVIEGSNGLEVELDDLHVR